MVPLPFRLKQIYELEKKRYGALLFILEQLCISKGFTTPTFRSPSWEFDVTPHTYLVRFVYLF